MSWNLAKKLRETHIGSSPQFSKSASDSTKNGKSKGEAGVPAISGNATSSNESTTAASQVQIQKTGILVVALYEGVGLSIPVELRNGLAQPASNGTGSARPGSSPRPSASLDLTRSQDVRGSFDSTHTSGRIPANHKIYAIIDFDKVQVGINSVGPDPENPLWAGSSTQFKFDVSRATELTVNLYARNVNVRSKSIKAQDIFLGAVQVNPRYEAKKPSVGDQKAKKKDRDSAAKDSGRAVDAGHSGVEWVPLQNGTGKLKIGVEYVENRGAKLTIEDFTLLNVVGRGSYGKVMVVQKNDTDRIYALKSIRKAKIISRSEVTHTLAERSVLAQINNPFIVPLKFAFQSPDKLYFVLAYVNGGELFYHLSKARRFDVNRSRFYIAELLCALECLHGFNVIYRDLKPENILLDYQGHIALCDFGLCKLEMKDEDSTNTFCGTPEYLAPEVLLSQPYNKTVDWWTLGVLLYEMLTGLPPYYDEDIPTMYRKIVTEPLHFPSSGIIPPAAKDLITKLLNRNPAERLGANGSAEIKEHPFFHSIDWMKLLQRKYQPSFKPNVKSASDVGNVDIEFASEHPEDSPVNDSEISRTQQQRFDGFSFVGPVAWMDEGKGSMKESSSFEKSV